MENDNTPSPEAQMRVPQSAIDWLLGEGPDAHGVWFEKPEGAPAFWWRDHFRKLITKEASDV